MNLDDYYYYCCSGTSCGSELLLSSFEEKAIYLLFPTENRKFIAIKIKSQEAQEWSSCKLTN